MFLIMEPEPSTAMAKRKKPSPSRQERATDPDVGWRLKITRAAYGHHGFDTKQNAFAAQLGLSPTRYGNYENGWPVRRQVMQQLLKRLPPYSVTEDWLYNGREETLSVGSRRLLREAQDWLEAKDKRGGGDAS